MNSSKFLPALSLGFVVLGATLAPVASQAAPTMAPAKTPMPHATGTPKKPMTSKPVKKPTAHPTMTGHNSMMSKKPTPHPTATTKM